MEQQFQNYQDASDNTLEEQEDESVNKKKLSTVVIVEIILFILVVILAIVFFSSRRGSNLFSFWTGVKTDKYGGIEVSKDVTSDIGVDKNKDKNTDFNPDAVPGDSDISLPSKGETTVVESMRLYLPVPKQSMVSLESDIPAGAIVIEGLESGFLPTEFKVAAGAELTLALTSRIDYPYTLTFYDDNMPAISIGLGPQETRWVTFNAPETPGEYIFRNDIFGRTHQTGKMIVE